MASPEEHLIMSERYHKRAIADFYTAESLEDIADKASYYSSSAEFLLLSLDHLLMWFLRSSDYSRKSRWKALEGSNKFKRLDVPKKNMIRNFEYSVESIRNQTLYLQASSLNEVINIGKLEVKKLLRRYDRVYRTIHGLR